MGDFGSGWRETIEDNLEVLSKCTIITPEMITLLLNHKLITPIQKDNLVDPTNLNHKPEITLYIRIAKQWTDADFEKFKLVLHESGNTLTLKILSQDLIPKKEISGLAACQNFASKVDNPIKETTRQEETEAEDLPSKKETKLSTETFPGVSKPTDMDEMSGVNETQLLLEVRQLKEKSTTEEYKLKTLERKFQELQKSTTKLLEELQLKTTEADEFRTVLNKLESETAKRFSSLEENYKCFQQLPTENVENQARIQADGMTPESVDTVTPVKSVVVGTEQSRPNVATSAAVNIESQLWSLDYLPNLEVEKAQGKWFLIEKFWRNSPPYIPGSSWEFNFARSGNIIKLAQNYVNSSPNKTSEDRYELTAAPETPHIWNFNNGYNYTWIKTDYYNYAIFVFWKGPSIESMKELFIFSRKQSLPSESLEMLRNIAVKYGFPTKNGVLIRHSSVAT